MKIYSWNMLFRNRQLDAAFRVVAGLDFDVLCLQEVPEGFLQRLKGLPLHLASGPDVSRLFSQGTVHDSLVILSKHKILNTGTFQIPIPNIPLRSKITIALMRPFGWSKIEGRGGLWADIETRELGVIRIIDAHFTLAHPAVRAQEFERTIERRAAASATIICGDFNIVESPRVSLINWLHGGSLLDSLLWWRERRQMEALFERNGFKNPLKNMTTHSFSASQLSHILIPDDFIVVEKKVLDERCGSDHYPVRVEIAQAGESLVGLAPERPGFKLPQFR